MKRWSIFLLIVLMIIMNACSPSSIKDSIEGQINEEFQTEVFIPEFKKYPILSVEIRYPPSGDKKDIIALYSTEKGKLKGEEYNKQYEENMNSKVLYGIYDGEPSAFRVTYSNYKIFEGDGTSKMKNIDGVDVQYKETGNEQDDFLQVFFNSKYGSYNIEFSLKEGLTKKKAFEIVEKIIVSN